ncbi:MAG: DNA gyrase/topoisomerase IV subunit A [Bacteroidales bacterium]|nr:DNA gyrase/topoisomerase IV subunit A [Bacteroidales bacterium]
MSKEDLEEYEDIRDEEIEETAEEVEEEAGEILDDDDLNAADTDKYDRLIAEGENKYKLSGMYKDWFLDYASYVILDRAVPHIEDGLKPVQRRILHAMQKVDDGHFHKVAGIVGDTMKYHPHGDASIKDALVGLGQKEYLIDCQGNWGNIFTGDEAAASRYIEARLSKFALEVAFNKKITEWVPSYDGTNQEPVVLPMKFPLLLAQGTEGIAVGLAVKILPHNFNELLDASIAALREKDFELYPDFPTGGLIDCSKYNRGLRGGKVKIRARIVKVDKRTLSITEIPYGQTTESLIDSIIKASDKGKIKIKKVDDMSSDTVDINIQLQNDVSPDKTIDALYAFTNCEVAISPNACVIMDRHPHFMGVDEILRYNAFHTKDLFEQELNILLDELEADWHFSSLEKIFFEKKVYRILENDASSWEQQLADVEAGMKQYQNLLRREITSADIAKLVEKPVRKISRFDIKAAEERIRGIEANIDEVRNNLEHLTDFTVRYFQQLKKKYGAAWPRRTEICTFEQIQAEKAIAANAKLYANKADGFVGIDQKKIENAEYICDCSDIAEIIVFMKDGNYMVTKVKDKLFVGKDIIHAAVFNRRDERTVYNVIYRDGRQGAYYAKRFSITGITRDKMYNLTKGTPNSYVVWFTANGNGEAETLRIAYKPRPKIKKLAEEFDFAKIMIKGRASMGNLVTKQNTIQRITLKSKGVSTLGGKEIWFDTDVNRLNDSGSGIYLGEFMQDDLVLVVLANGTYYTTSYELTNRYQGEILRIEKFDPAKVFSAIYYDGSVKMFYIKRFCFEPYNNVNPSSFIAEEPGSKFVAITDDFFPQAQVSFKGKSKGKEPEKIDVEEFVEKYGLKAKGRRLTAKDIGKVEFIEPLEKEMPEPEPEQEPEQEPETAPEQEPTPKPAEEPAPAPAPAPADEPEPDDSSAQGVVKDPFDLTLF